MDRNNGIPFFGLNIEFNRVRPLDSNRTVSYFNQFVVKSIHLLNKFAVTCDTKLKDLDLKLQNVEATLAILEAKLSSVPGLVSTTTISSNTTKEETLPKTENVINLNQQAATLPEVETSRKVDEPPSPPETVENEEENHCPDPRVEPYLKMVRVGVPVMAVQLKMKAEGLEPDLINYVVKATG